MHKKIISFFSLVLSDVSVIVISFFLAFLIRSEILPPIIHKLKQAHYFPLSHFLKYYYMIVVWIFIFAYERLYTKRYIFWEEVKILTKSATLSSSIIMIAIFITKSQFSFSRVTVVSAWLISLLLFPIFRYWTKILLIKAKLWTKKLLIIGANKTGFATLNNIKANKAMGYQVVGFVSSNKEKVGKQFENIKVIGLLSQIERISQSLKVKDIMIAMPDLSKEELNQLIKRCENLCDSMWLIPRTGDLITTGVEIESLGRILTLRMKQNLTKPWNLFLKSVFEKLLTLVLLALLSPLLALAAIAIKIESKGAIIFKQKRIGSEGEKFNIYKFRSMHTNSDERLKKYLYSNPQAKEEWEKFKKLKRHDPRLTRAGKMLRKFSLDELPQLLNVLQGKMALVGPRPYIPEEIQENDPFKNMIIRVKPGITGLWQVSGRNELSFKERQVIDEYYIRNWSLWLDLTILMKSIKVFLSREGAY